MESSTNQLREGLSTTRPPLLTGNNYAHWKNRMRIYIQSISLKMWIFLGSKYVPPTSEQLATLTDDIIANAEMNAKLMNIFACGVDTQEYGRISGCDTAYEIWKLLESHHEGSSRMKETRVDIFVRKYELFSMQPGESISEMNTRFTEITNNLKNLGKKVNEGDKVRKVLRSLSNDWEKKTTAIEEAQDLNTLSMEDLIGSLMAYEIQMNGRKEIESSKKKEKVIALKANFESEKSDDDESDEELAMMVKRFKKRWIKDKFQRKRRDDGESSKGPICYGCDKVGHIKKDCPLIQSKERKGKKRRENEEK